MQAMGGGLGFVNYIALGTLIADFLKSVVLIILFIQGIRLINFIIKNKGLSNVTINNIIEKDDKKDDKKDNHIENNIIDNEDIFYASNEEDINKDNEDLE